MKGIKKEFSKLNNIYKSPNLSTNSLLEESVVVIIPREILIQIDSIEGFWNMRIKPFNVNTEYLKEVVQTFFLPIAESENSSRN
jgi:hypothetical protein